MLSCHTWLFFPHLGRTEAPSSIVVVIVCVCVCVCLHTEFISLIHQDIFNGKIESYFYFFHKRGTCLHTSYSMLNYFH